VATHE